MLKRKLRSSFAYSLGSVAFAYFLLSALASPMAGSQDRITGVWLDYETSDVYLRARNFDCEHLPLALERDTTCHIRLAGQQFRFNINRYPTCTAFYAERALSCVVDTTDDKLRLRVGGLDPTTRDQAIKLRSRDLLATVPRDVWILAGPFAALCVSLALLVWLWDSLDNSQARLRTKTLKLIGVAGFLIPTSVFVTILWIGSIGYVD
jgi:hypothetical protein